MRNFCYGLSAATLLCGFGSTATADTAAFTITDDAALDATIASVRSSFLANKTFSRLDVALLVPGPNGTWRRGSYNPDAINYPASCVKLGYMAAAMYWQRINNRPYDSLDSSVGPMIRVSDNYQTGVVVDTITGQPNVKNISSTSSPSWPSWYAKRLFTENYLASRGLLDNQTVLHKTYPTNSGSSPSGAELTAINFRGRNQMQPRLSASLMLEINKGALEPGATSYMRDLLTHARQDANGDSCLGYGLPPGTVYENKIGVAYDTLEDIAYAKLPNGQEFIIAAYSNAYVAPYTSDPLPQDGSQLGPFMESLVEALGYDTGNPPKLKIDDGTAAFSTSGSWSTGTAQPDKFGNTYAFKTGGNGSGTATYTLSVPATGRYEVSVWYPQGSNRATDAPFTVNHAQGSTLVRVNQQQVGGRWLKLGDFNFNAGQGTVVLADAIANASQVVVADAVKAVQWPANRVINVASLTMGRGTTNYTATAAVTLRDSGGAPLQLAGIKVTGVWSGAGSGSQTVSTDAAGVARFTSPVSKKGGTFTFTVNNVIKEPYGYNAAANAVSVGSISNP